jgi:hypothetical protein
MTVHDGNDGVCADKEARILEAEADRLDELAALREEHAREERAEAQEHKAHVREDLEEIRRLQEHIHHEEEEAARNEASARREDDQAKHDREEGERLREEGRRKEHCEHHVHVVEITAVVAGKGVLIEARKDQTLADVRDEALKRTDNVGQPPENWEIKDEAGHVLNPATTVGDCHFGPQVTLYITLKAGAAGEGQTVDPTVSLTKFDREIELFREGEADYRKRGIFLIKAQFPKARFLIATTKTTPVTIPTAVEIDFTDFDLRPASVVFVDPFDGSHTPLKKLQFSMLRRVAGIGSPNGAPALNFMAHTQQIIQANSPEDIPFICLPGIREYHDNPAHSGDSWLSHRASGEGSLAFILDKIWMYGSNTIEQLNFQMQPIFAGYIVQGQGIPA